MPAEVGMVLRTLFDTELGGRLLGLPKVSLGALAERALGKALLKEHSAADWSKRPLPDEWLTYAALDVELLADLREWMASELESAGKLVWAQQEFAHLAAHASDPPAPRDDPWRRTSGLHALRKPTTLAVVRELWADARRSGPRARPCPEPGAGRRCHCRAGQSAEPAHVPGWVASSSISPWLLMASGSPS